MKILLTLIALTGALLLNGKALAQSRTADSIRAVRKVNTPTPEQQKQLQHQYYKRLLKGDTEKAQKVQDIMEAYKAEMKAVEKDATLNPEAKRAKFKQLIEDKNRKLEAFLSAEELDKLVPMTERKDYQGAKKN